MQFSVNQHDPSTGYTIVDVDWVDYDLQNPNNQYVAVHPYLYFSISPLTTGAGNICLDYDATLNSVNPNFTAPRLEPLNNHVYELYSAASGFYLDTKDNMVRVMSLYIMGEPGTLYEILESLDTDSYFDLEQDIHIIEGINTVYGNFEEASIQGAIKFPIGMNGAPTCNNADILNGISGVDIHISGPAAQDVNTCLYSILDLNTYMSNGTYNFEVMKDLNYTIRPEKLNDPGCGINYFDVEKLRDIILGMNPNPSFYPLQAFIASDMDNNSMINAFDVLALERFLLDGTVPPNFKSWEFIDKAVYDANDPPTSTIVPNLADFITFNPLLSSVSGQDFAGVKIGDINQSCNNCDNPLVGGNDDRELGNPIELAFDSDSKKTNGAFVDLLFYMDLSKINTFGIELGFLKEKIDLVELELLDEVISQYKIDTEAGLLKIIGTNLNKDGFENSGKLPFLKIKGVLLHDVQSLNKLFYLEDKTGNFAFSDEGKHEIFLESRSQNFDIKIFPNPTVDVLNVEFPNEGFCSIDIFNQLGIKIRSQEILVEKNGLTAIDFSQYPTGFYVVKISGAGSEYTSKIFKL